MAIFFLLNTLYICKRELRVNILYKNKGEFNMSRVLISMPERFLDEIDNVAENENRSRSELSREALRTYIHRNRVRSSAYAQRNAELLDALLD